MKQKILITPRTFGTIDTEPLEVLRNQGYELVSNPFGRLLTEKEMIDLISDVDAIIVGLDPLSVEVISAAPRLKIISKYGIGVDNIAVDFATQQKIMVTNTPGANSSAVAELTMGLILDVARKISFSDRQLRQNQWGKYLGFELKDKTLGVIGTGQIGKEVAVRAKGLGMKLIGYDLIPDYQWARTVDAVYSSLDELLSSADVISLHLPLADDTYHLISEREFALMKETAILINTARGGIVDEKALLRALEEKEIAGAGLDVYEQEPPTDSPLRSLDNVVLTSHIGAHTFEAIARMGRMAVENVVAGLSGRRPPFLLKEIE
ncbi:MAG: phosphoglycerate dehydrogenase [Firmicutes bacterium]|nr:phosphoglycerate dehydrogenase [Bacillota bacterium]